MDTERSPGSKKIPSASNQASGGSTFISSLDNLVTYLVLGVLVVAINVALIVCIGSLVYILNNPVRDPDIPLALTSENTTQPGVANKVITSTTTTGATTSENQVAEEIKKYMNISVSPCEDFYSYACGGWHALKEVQDSTVEISSISITREKTRRLLIDLLRKTSKEGDPNYKAEPRKIFAACNNKENLQERGTKPFLIFLDSIGSFPILDPNWDPDMSFCLPMAMRKMALLNIPSIFSIKRATLSGDSRFVLREPDFNLPIRSDEAWMKNTLQLLGVDTNDASIKKDIDDMYQFEHTLYTLSKDTTYSSRKVEELQSDMPIWFVVLDFFKLIASGNSAEQQQITDKTEIILDRFSYVMNVGKLFHESGGGLDPKTRQPFSPQHIRRVADNYILKVLLSLTSWTDPKFKSLKEFNYPQTNNRETTCLDHVLKLFPAQVHKLYVDEVYQSQSDTYISDLTTGIRASLEQRITETTLLEYVEKNFAYNTVESGLIKAGNLKIEPNEVLNNVYKMGPTDEFFEYSLETLKHEFNKSLWLDVGAWYSLQISFYADPEYYPDALDNFLAIQAPFLQPPAMSLKWPRSMNYGAIGTLASHEMLKFWLDGKYWWDHHASLPHNKKKTQCIIDKYEKYMFQGSKINGHETLLNNIYDNEGIKTSYRAYQNYIKNKGMEPQLTWLNFTHNQLFFIGYTQLLCQKIPKSLTDEALSRNFAPNKIRVLGSLMNFKRFSEVFKCKADDPMNPPNKCLFL